MTAPVPARLHQPSRQPEGDGGRVRVCTCPEADERERAGIYTCAMDAEPHRVDCPRWGMKLTHPMTGPAVDVEQLLEAAKDEVVRLAEGGRWIMRVPADETRDSDTLLMAALTRAGDLIRRQDAALTAVRELADALDIDAASEAMEAESDDLDPHQMERQMGRSEATQSAADALRAALASPDTTQEA